MFEIALYQPEIPPNTGNIIRLCANFGIPLHIIGPTGFELDDRHLRRAGLDYHALANVLSHQDYGAFLKARVNSRLIGFSTKAVVPLHRFVFHEGDILLFGPETRGLPDSIRDSLPANQCLRIAMQADSRSLNLSNAVAIATYEAAKQLGLSGLK